MQSLTAADIDCARRTIEIACAAVERGDFPFAAMLVGADGAVLFEGSNVAAQTGDPHDHAEMQALRSTVRAHGHGPLAGATLYCSGEPCAMCAGTILRYGIARVVWSMPERLLLRYLGNGSEFKSYPSAGIFALAGEAMEVHGEVLLTEAARPFELFLARIADRGEATERQGRE